MILFVLAVIFILTYKPSSGVLDKYISGPVKARPTECESGHFRALQFGEESPSCKMNTTDKLGAIMSRENYQRHL